jgi:ribosomal protein S18 acetylase RimI-like enzyme
LRTFDFYEVKAAAGTERDWVHAQMESRWGGRVMAVHGEGIDTTALPALVARERRGFLVYRVQGLAAEIVVMDALEAGLGIGTAMLVALSDALERIGVQEVWATTTNDNLDALRFYQRRGFRLEAVRRDAVAQVRHLKPAIPAVGAFGIPICDEVDLRGELPLGWAMARRPG